MIRTLRLAGLHIALAATVLHALVPPGWMPGQGPGAPLIICTAEGGITLKAPAQRGHPADHSDRDHQLCPFAAAVHVAVAANAIALPAPSAFGRTLLSAPSIARGEPPFTPYSSRAPPVREV